MKINEGLAFFTFSSFSFEDTFSFVTILNTIMLDGSIFANISFIIGCILYFLIAISKVWIYIQVSS